ncbi:DUF2861 family protein [Vibrio sinaloensis]|uniref:DUF2861 family protein n=1 Tax=Photobacterium sp. (strain ATCC 43367) TaxID=379097 RepID=UPI0020483CB2|nr:DUF2861 family protein [Vibrio sinaloensis]UPQ89907.1 DUF2861 family protein [Vibrio sinaloensis]
MIRKSLLLSALILSSPLMSEPVPWFETNSALIQAHKSLLDGDLTGMFSSLVEVWQLEDSQTITPHLNELFVQSLEVDCGKGLDRKPLPQWLHNIVVRRTEIQSPGRDAYRAIVEATSSKDIVDIRLTKWVSKVVSTDNTFMVSSSSSDNDTKTFTKRYNLNSRVDMGLYRIDITAADQTTWSSWLVLGEPFSSTSVRWNAKAEWEVERNALLNPHCPLPKLDISIYDYVDGNYNQVWNQRYESDYPTTIEKIAIDPGRYVLAVSVNSQRWQGPIIVEQSQIISKTYDVSVEE